MKTRPLGDEFFPCRQAEGKTDAGRRAHEEANSSFARFCERAPKKIHQIAAPSITTARRTVQVSRYNPYGEAMIILCEKKKQHFHALCAIFILLHTAVFRMYILKHW